MRIDLSINKPVKEVIEQFSVLFVVRFASCMWEVEYNKVKLSILKCFIKMELCCICV